MSNPIRTLSAEQYFAAHGISKSALDWIAPPKTPADFKAHVLDQKPSEETQAMRFGSIVHRAVFEPDTVAGAFVVMPEGLDGRTKEGKAWKAENAGKVILSGDEAQAVEAMREAIHAHPMAKRLLASGSAEQCLFAQDNHGTMRKARVDWIPTKGNAIVDLKTTQDATPDEFAKSILKFRYHVQAAFYLDLANLLGMERQTFVFIAVEKSAPWKVGVYAIDPESIAIGRAEYQRDLTLYRYCMERNEWPGLSRDVETIGLPGWYRKHAEQAI